MQKQFDIILFGATGFTGQLTAQYLAAHAKDENLSWAIAGRNETKLKSIAEACTANSPQLVLADVDNPSSLAEMAAKTTVLMNAAGPFNLYGKRVVEACIEAGTHYLDITGEPSFVASLYNQFSEKAREKKACIVNCCGFDSIPADLAAWITAKKLPQGEPKLLQGFIRTNATFSGGTLTTAIHALYMETQGKSEKVKLPKHPAAPKKSLRIHFHKKLRAWAIPMPVVDPHIVKRSAFHLQEDYGQAVTYVQYFVRSSLKKVIQTVLPIVIAMLLVRFRFFRNWLFSRFKPGTGPNAERRKASRFEVVCFGSTPGMQAVTYVSGGDPGYDETAKMFSQAAFTVLEKQRKGILASGVLTPVQALGETLVQRLRAEGMRIE
jgi:short subunit dehydrogenase-like uncharacterized protein